MTKHTPGPFEIDSLLDQEHAAECMKEGDWIGILAEDGHVAYCHPDNASLFASVHDLLSALEGLVNDLPEMDTDEPISGSDAVDALARHWEDIKAAIAKANGIETP